MYRTGLPLVLVGAAPIGSALEAYGNAYDKGWAKTWGQRTQYVSSVALLTLATIGAAWSRAPVPMAISGLAIVGFLAIPIIKLWVWDPKYDIPAGIVLKITSGAALIVAAWATTPFIFALATLHLLPSDTIRGKIFG